MNGYKLCYKEENLLEKKKKEKKKKILKSLPPIPGEASSPDE